MSDRDHIVMGERIPGNVLSSEPPDPLGAVADRLAVLEERLHDLAVSVRTTFEDDHRGMDYFRRELESTQAAFLDILQGKDPTAIPTGIKDIDEQWRCPCGAKLGLYSAREDLLRIKIREQYITFRVGHLGFVEITCYKCGRTVREEDSSGAATE